MDTYMHIFAYKNYNKMLGLKKRENFKDYLFLHYPLICEETEILE